MEEWQFSLEALILTFIFDHKETNYKLWSNTNFKKKNEEMHLQRFLVKTWEKSTTLLKRIIAKTIFLKKCFFLNHAFACEMKQLSLLKLSVYICNVS